MGPLDTNISLEVPPDAWSGGMVRDMYKYCLGLPPRVITMQLLNDMEFLIFLGYQSKGKGMAYQSNTSIRQLDGVTQWASIDVIIKVGQQTIIESHKDVAKTKEY